MIISKIQIETVLYLLSRRLNKVSFLQLPFMVSVLISKTSGLAFYIALVALLKIYII